MTIQKLLAPPNFENDAEKTRAAAVLNALQLALLAVVGLSGIATIFLFEEKVGSLLVEACVMGVLLISRWLMLRGRVRLASVIVIAGTWIMVTLLVAFAGGMNSIDAVHYIAVTVIGGLLLGERATISIALASCLAGFAMILSERLGYPLPQIFPLPAVAGWVNFTLGLFLVTTTLNIALRSLHDALATARQEVAERERAEAALRTSEGRVRAILEAATDVSFIVTDAHPVEPLVLEFSPGAERIFGYRREEMIGQPVEVLHLPEEVAQFPEAMREMREGRLGFHGETRLVRRSGEVFPAQFSTYPLFDAEGQMYAALGISIDIAERERAVAALHAEEEKFRQIVQASPMGIHIYELNQDGQLIFTGSNAAADRILGVANAQFIGRTLEEAFPGLVQTEVPAHYRRAARDGVPWQTEQIQYEDTQIRGAYQVYAFQTGQDRATVMFLDITERKQAEQERERLLAQIQGQAQQMQQMIDTVPEGVILLDADARVTLANPLGEKYLHKLGDATEGEQLTHLGPQSLSQLLDPPTQGLWHEITIKERNLQIVTRPLDAAAPPQGWLLVIRDVTRQREIEQHLRQQDRLAAVGQLAAGIAHDFNNIMATVVLYAQMSARAPGVPERVRERLNIIHQQAIHATQLIQQILDFSRRAVFERVPFDLRPLLKEQVKILKRTLPEHIDVSLDLDHDPGDEAIIKGSPAYLQQVLMNLAVNARDAMPGGGKLRFGLARLAITPDGPSPLPEMRPGDWIEIAVADTGTGIDPEIEPHIFDPFFTTKDPDKGTGLGLAQVHGIIGMHEGHIGVETEPGVGTTFSIYLPALPAHPCAPPVAQQLPEHIQGCGETILVVEDNAATRAALVDSLETLNYHPLVAENGRQALERLEAHPGEIALVLSDVVMPEMGGIALLRAMQARAIAVPVILLTGHPLKAELQSLRQSDAAPLLADWLLKPPSLVPLSQALARALADPSRAPGSGEAA